MPDIELNGRTVSYTLRRSARRTVGLTVSREGLRVTAPQRMALRDVQAALQQKARWILTKLDTVAARPAAPAARAFETGAVLPYRGGTLTLVVEAADGGRGAVVRAGDELRVRAGTAAGAAEEAVRWWYGQEAVAVFAERLDHFVPLVGKGPQKVTVKEQQRRWGSCSAQGNIALNWRLVLAPPAVADFVIVHELCHLHHMDHSPAFWTLVEGVLPGYREQRAWLREHGDTLAL